ncbi:type II toxin-antitoxin system HicB family antitoxin [Nostoc sp.]|uniref:type II toxin-antitoxin system HicB family antitoxin n=1 Tax=Nostoc sp. TaxID=1180 RepID=UPI003FA5E594
MKKYFANSVLEEVKQMIAEAIEFHLEGMLEDGLPIPQPTSIAYEVEVANIRRTAMHYVVVIEVV